MSGEPKPKAERKYGFQPIANREPPTQPPQKPPAPSVTRGASRHQHDTLDQIIAKAILHTFPDLRGVRVALGIDSSARAVDVCAAAVRDALLAEGEIRSETKLGREFASTDPEDKQRVLVIPLLVGVGCGNAKKDTP